MKKKKKQFLCAICHKPFIAPDDEREDRKSWWEFAQRTPLGQAHIWCDYNSPLKLLAKCAE